RRSFAGSRPVIATRAPSWRKPRAIARPMPLPPPVTRTTLPVRLLLASLILVRRLGAIFVAVDALVSVAAAAGCKGQEQRRAQKQAQRFPHDRSQKVWLQIRREPAMGTWPAPAIVCGENGERVTACPCRSLAFRHRPSFLSAIPSSRR